jgi:multiple sugar transport system substrate-binding protein
MTEPAIGRRAALKMLGTGVLGLAIGTAIGLFARPPAPSPAPETTTVRVTETRTVTEVLTSTVTTTLTPEVVGPVTLTFAQATGSGEEIVAKPLLEKWNQANPDIQVEFVPLPSTADEQYRMLVTQLTAGMGPDIFILDDQWVAAFAEAGFVLPIDEYIPKEKILEEYISNIIETTATYKGRIWGLPYWPDVHATFYRKDLLEKHGVEEPKTWDELIKAAQTIMKKEGNMVGYTWPGMEFEGLTCMFLWTLWGFGGEWIDPDGKVRINEPPAVEALQLLHDLIHEYEISPKGVLTYTEEDARMPFHEGRAVFHTNWTYVWGTSQAEDSPIRGKVWMTTNPYPSGGSPASIIGAWFLGINSNTKHVREAIKFYQWFTSYDNEKYRMLSEWSYISVRKKIYEDPEVLEAWPHAKMLYEVETTAKARPRHPKYTEMSDELQKYVHAALSGTMEAQEALDRLAEATERIMKGG